MTGRAAADRGPVRPLVSVVMGVYNGESHVRQALESVLRQEEIDLELIVVDDGSTDTTASILREYAERDRRLRTLSQGNQGLTAALIRGCLEARGDYVARQDADDVSHPGRLRTLADRLSRDPGLVMASSGTRAMGPAGEVLYETTGHPEPVEATRRLLEERMGPIHGSVMFRRDAYHSVGGYRAAFYYAQDSDLWLRLAETGRIGYAAGVLYAYRAIAGVSRPWRDIQRRFGELSHLCRAARQRGEDEGPVLERAAALGIEARLARLRPAGPQALAGAHYFVASALLGRGDGRAVRYLLATLRADPRHAAAWTKLLALPLLLAYGRARA